MEEISIHKLKQSKYKEGAELGLMNAKNHLLVSLEAARINQFGIAKGLLILATEELAKASVLKIKSIYNSMVIHNLNLYFESHQIKHKSIFNLFIASYDFIDNEPKIHKEENNSKNNSNIWIIGLVILILFGYLIYISQKEDKNKPKNTNINASNDSDLKNNDNTNKTKLDKIKETGFYLGFNSKTGEWEYPNHLHDKLDYEELKKIVDMGVGVIESTLFKGKINRENIIDFSKKMEDKNIFPKRIRKYRKNI